MLLSAIFSVVWLIIFVFISKRYLNNDEHTKLKLVIIIILTFLHLHIFANKPGWNGVVNTLIIDILFIRSFYIIILFSIKISIKYKFFNKSLINVTLFISFFHFILKYLM